MGDSSLGVWIFDVGRRLATLYCVDGFGVLNCRGAILRENLMLCGETKEEGRARKQAIAGDEGFAGYGRLWKTADFALFRGFWRILRFSGSLCFPSKILILRALSKLRGRSEIGSFMSPYFVGVFESAFWFHLYIPLLLSLFLELYSSRSQYLLIPFIL